MLEVVGRSIEHDGCVSSRGFRVDEGNPHVLSIVRTGDTGILRYLREQCQLGNPRQVSVRDNGWNARRTARDTAQKSRVDIYMVALAEVKRWSAGRGRFILGWARATRTLEVSEMAFFTNVRLTRGSRRTLAKARASQPRR